jgi:hypothetical protein
MDIILGLWKFVNILAGGLITATEVHYIPGRKRWLYRSEGHLARGRNWQTTQ